MNLTMMECMRWYGLQDSVPLSHIQQAGATGVYTALHHIPYGELWSRDQIRECRNQIESAGLKWVAVESVAVHEDIKTRSGDYGRYIGNYQQTLRNLGAEGIALAKKAPANPGYTAIGRLRGPAGIRGLQWGISRSLYPEQE
jgi:mannonate dehydratase